MGDPAFATPPTYDQRGFAFERIVEGRVDIGAVESSAVSADFDLDGDVDGHDFLTWQRGFGTSPSAAHSQGDANVDGSVAAADLAVWQQQYSTTPVAISPPVSDLAAAQQSEHTIDAALIDAAMAFSLRENQSEEEDIVVVDTDAFDAAFDAWTKPIPQAESAGRIDEFTATDSDVDEPSETLDAYFTQQWALNQVF